MKETARVEVQNMSEIAKSQLLLKIILKIQKFYEDSLKT